MMRVELKDEQPLKPGDIVVHKKGETWLIVEDDNGDFGVVNLENGLVKEDWYDDINNLVEYMFVRQGMYHIIRSQNIVIVEE